MILKHVEAQNILKYNRLHLTDLPANGQIAVAGPNEAGKTAIGETICFAVFGRTFSLGREDLFRVIRWGEYSGSASVTFTDGDGTEFTVARQIDSNRSHHAQMYQSGESSPVAEGVDAVDDAVRNICGFTYQSFVDSFYLAQRELEVPSAKSATVKALIGVDKLETVADDLESEISRTTKGIAVLETEIKEYNRRIAVLNIDRARLGCLETERKTKHDGASADDAQAAELSNVAGAIAESETALTAAAERFVKTTSGTSYAQWRKRLDHLSQHLNVAERKASAAELSEESSALAQTKSTLDSLERGLTEYGKVRDLAKLYGRRLAFLLDDQPLPRVQDVEMGRKPEHNGTCFAHRRASLEVQIDQMDRQRKITLVSAVFTVEIALLASVGWIAPGTVVGGWMNAVVGASGGVRSVGVLLIAIATWLVVAASTAIFVRSLRHIRRYRAQVDEIDVETELATAEIEVIDAIDEAPIPTALKGLRCVRNDLLASAVAVFLEGDGRMLVESTALASTLDGFRGSAKRSLQALRGARKRLLNRAAEFRGRADDTRSEIEHIDEELAEERKRWERFEALERKVAALAAKANELRHHIVVRTVGRELIEGTCRRIYERFHPELRAFVGRILPQLTENRYEQIELDDDLRVRVYCKDKNDFVGLTELSNGTHRQLMLCVRLALSQALIASSSKSSQFIFFDEPFAFFDERRKAQAIDVLRKISPEITQVFLAAQRFDDPDSFDMYLNCEVDTDVLVASGKPHRRIRVAS